MCIYLEQAMNIGSGKMNIISSFNFLASIETDFTGMNLIGPKVAIIHHVQMTDELDIEPIWFWLTMMMTTTTTTEHCVFIYKCSKFAIIFFFVHLAHQRTYTHSTFSFWIVLSADFTLIWCCCINFISTKTEETTKKETDKNAYNAFINTFYTENQVCSGSLRLYYTHSIFIDNVITKEFCERAWAIVTFMASWNQRPSTYYTP